MSKRKLAALVAEVVGTFVLAIVVLSISRYGLPIFTALAAGVAYAAMYTAFGGHFNPAITLGFFSIRRIGAVKTLFFIASQAVGAVLAWKLYEWFVGRAVPLAGSQFDWKIFVAEMLGTLVFAVGIAAAIKRGADNNQMAVALGTTVFLGASLASLVAAAGPLNPAVAIAQGFRPENSGYLAYLFGPIVGAVVGMNFYNFAFADTKVKAAVAASAAPATSTAAKPAARKAAKRKATKRSTKA